MKIPIGSAVEEIPFDFGRQVGVRLTWNSYQRTVRLPAKRGKITDNLDKVRSYEIVISRFWRYIGAA